MSGFGNFPRAQAGPTHAYMVESTEQSVLHDRINLARLVRKLEKSVQDREWGEDVGFENWTKTQGALQVCLAMHFATATNRRNLIKSFAESTVCEDTA